MRDQQSTDPSRGQLSIEGIVKPSTMRENVPLPVANLNQSRSEFRTLREHDGIVALFYLSCDIVCWVLLYGVVGYLRRDQFFATPFEFVLVDCITLAVILQSLYI